MTAIIVDDENFCIEYLEMMCMQIPDFEIVKTFNNALDALDFLSSHREIELVLMDIEMPGLNGMDAIRRMRTIIPHLGVIYVTGYEAYALEAFQVDALSYLLKPCCLSELKKAIERASHFLPSPTRVEIHTFGNFSISIDGEPYRFANKKAKELLALLIDKRGAIVSLEQAIDTLWENRPMDENVKQLYRKAIISLNQLCREKELDFFVSNRGSCHIIPSKLSCDYFRLVNGDPEALGTYSGKYMTDYSWAEETNGELFYWVEKHKK